MQRSTFRIMTSKDKASKVPLSSTMPAVVVSIIFMPALCSTADVTCSKPNQPSLLAALTPIFNLSAIRPVLNQTTVTNVSVSFTLYGILGVDEKAQLLTTYIWLDYWWMNEFISWDQAQCGAKKISLPKEKFWLPDIVINEFMEENKAPSVPYVYLYNDGAVHDAMPVRVVSSCNLNIYTFPFDVQNCSLTFNSYIYYAFEIQVLLGSPAENITEDSKSVMTTMGEWELLDITALKTPNNDTMLYIDELAFYIRLRRRATMYVVNLLLPSCFLITVDLFSFLLPPQSVDRSSFKMTLILGYTVFLLIMNDLLPITGNTIPLINVFFSLCLALMVASLLETILITNLFCNSAGFSPVPRWIRVLILKIIGCLVCMPQKKPKDSVQRTSTVVARGESDGGPRETKGSSEDNKALQELRSLNKVLLDIRVQVEQQQKGKQSSEDWIQCCLMKIKPSKHLCILVSLLMIASCSSAALNCSQPGPTSLLSSLQTAFDLSAIRPVVNMSTPTTVSIGFTLYGILGVDEKAQVLTTYIWQNLEWQNEFTTWNAEECGVEWVAIPRTLLWVPDVVINEFMEKNTAPDVPYTYLFYSGQVYDNQPVRVVSSCRLDIYLFPFDIQNCTFTFNSYIHSIYDIKLDNLTSAEEILKNSQDSMTTMGEWELIGIKSELKRIETLDGFAYDELHFYISVRRHPIMYVVNLLMPSCFLITVDLFSFMLPAQDIDRSLFKMTLVLGYTVFLLSTNNLLPITGNTIPLINVFLSLCLILMVSSMMEAILITNFLRGSAHYAPPPCWVRKFVIGVLGQIVRLPAKTSQQGDTVIENPNKQEMEDLSQVAEENEKEQQNEDETVEVLKNLGSDLQVIHLQVLQHLKATPSYEEWIQFGLVIDRLLFIFYIIFITVSFISIILIWVNSYKT